MKAFLNKKEIENAGFIYEPDRSKCKSLKLNIHVPKDDLVNDEFKQQIVKEIPFVYVHQVTETPNPYEGNPDFLADPKVLVIGHTRKIYHGNLL
jgi:hypothetical protein